MSRLLQIFAITLIFSQPLEQVSAEDVTKTKIFDIPVELTSEQLLKKYFPNYFTPPSSEPALPHGLIYEKLYPIGWTDDGRFVYVSEPPDQACGCYFVDLVIRDLKANNVSWHRYYSSDDPSTVFIEAPRFQAPGEPKGTFVPIKLRSLEEF